MFTIIYNKSDGKVLNITSESNSENLRKAIPESNDFIFVDELPEYNFYRQKLSVKNGSLIVENLILTAEQEKQIIKIETLSEIEKLKEFLNSTDYKALKFIDGALTEEEYAPIREERQKARDKINELEIKDSVN